MQVRLTDYFVTQPEQAKESGELAQKDKKNNQGKGGQKKAQNLINPHAGTGDPE